jgi:hypothetical protein
VEDLSLLEGRIGGFYEVVELLQWPRTQVHNRLVRERRKSSIWVPGQLPRPVFRIHATPVFDLDMYRQYIHGASFDEHNFYYGYGETRAMEKGWQEQ